MAYQYQQKIYGGSSYSTYIGYVNYDLNVPIQHKLTLGESITITGQAYRNNGVIKSIYCDIAGTGIWTIVGLFDFGSTPESAHTLRPGIGYASVSIEKQKTGTFSITIPVTQDLLTRLYNDAHVEPIYTPDADQGNNVYDYADYFRFTFLASTHNQNIVNPDASYIVPISDNANTPHYSFITNSRQDTTIDEISFYDCNDEYPSIDTLINGETPYDYFEGFIEEMSDPVMLVKLDMDERDTCQLLHVEVSLTFPDGVTVLKYGDGTILNRDVYKYYYSDSIPIRIGETRNASLFSQIYYRFPQSGTYTYTVTVKMGNPGNNNDTITGSFNVFQEYIEPNISDFAVSRTEITQQTRSASFGNYIQYDIDSNISDIIAQGQPSVIINDTELTLSFTRKVNGVDVSYVVDADPSGTGIVTVNGEPLIIDNEEMFDVVVTLSDGINSVSMTSSIEANFAIFNCSSDKKSIGIGKYCDGLFTGLDIDMAVNFRRPVIFNDDVTFLKSPIEVLWVNPSPRSSISGSKTMSRAVEDGELLICGYRYNGDSTIAGWHNFCFVGADTMTLFAGNASNNRNGTRALTFTANSSSFTVGACTFNNATHNDYLIPNYIAAVKGFKLTSAMLSEWTAPT